MFNPFNLMSQRAPQPSPTQDHSRPADRKAAIARVSRGFAVPGLVLVIVGPLSFWLGSLMVRLTPTQLLLLLISYLAVTAGAIIFTWAARKWVAWLRDRARQREQTALRQQQDAERARDERRLEDIRRKVTL